MRLVLLSLAAMLVAAPSGHATTPGPGSVPGPGPDAARLEADFLAFDPGYVEARRKRTDATRTLAATLIRGERKGRVNTCAHQILFEVISLIPTSADFERIDERIAALQAAMTAPQDDRPDADGLWGSCFNQWYLKLYATYDRLSTQGAPPTEPQPLPAFLEPVATPEKLRRRLEALAVSDVRTTGLDHGREYNETLSVLIRMLVHGRPQNYSPDPALRQALLDIVAQQQDPATGFWGQQYRQEDGFRFGGDLSTTFHVISYLRGEVPNWPRIIETTLAVRDYDYPQGWRWRGRYWNHMSMDVVTIFQYAWPHATADQRARMTTEIEAMLAWCLTESLQADGSFEPSLADGSSQDSQYYGASFLARIGYFDPARRFWTDREFPEAAEVRERILKYVRAQVGTGSSAGYSGVFEALGASPTP